MPEVSVIIPVYNNEKFVEACVRSLMVQTCRDLEIIVINDGSTDKSGEILERLAKEDGRIRLYSQRNAGVAAARNKGLDEMTGDYLTFVDGDDYVSADYIEKLLNRAKESSAEMVICGLTYVDGAGTILKTIVPGPYQKFEKEEWTFRISAVCSHLYRRSLWEKYGIRFTTGERGEDMPVSLFFGAVCERIDTLPEAGYYYVQHRESAMHNFRGLKCFQLPYRALEKAISDIQAAGVKNSSDFHGLFVLRILATCYFDLGRGASKKERKKLCEYIIRIMNQYYPQYYKNRLTRLFSSVEVPFSQKIAVKLLVILIRTRLLYPVSALLNIKLLLFFAAAGVIMTILPCFG